MLKIEYLEETDDVYDIEVQDNHNFYANDILVHNCQEVTIPTEALENYEEDDSGSIAQCILSAINWGMINKPSEFEYYCSLAVRGLNELIDYQDYPLIAGRRNTMKYRPIGIGISNLAYFLAKRDLKYGSPECLEVIDEYAESWSYYIIKASMELAKEIQDAEYKKGIDSGYVRWNQEKNDWEPYVVYSKINSKYLNGILPIDTYKSDVDDLVPFKTRMPWDQLREDLKKYGTRNACLMALMPTETSSVIVNATSATDPVRSLITKKKNGDIIFSQVVPEFKKLKKKYEILWDMDTENYIKTMAVLQKYVDQSISTNTSYNPKHYYDPVTNKDSLIPMSKLMGDLLNAYKYGIKTLYYCNTEDGSGEVNVKNLISEEKYGIIDENNNEENCEGCTL